MAAKNSWMEWVQAQDTYSPELENGKAIGQALEIFETSLLSRDTSIWCIRADRPTFEIRKGEVDYNKLAVISRENLHDPPSYEFFFVSRSLIKNESEPEPPDAHKLRISVEALRLLTSRYYVCPAFLLSLSRFYFPNGPGFRHYEGARGKMGWNQWYFLPIRVQVPCTEEKRSHATSSTGSNQMNPFHYLHLADEKVDIRGSQIAVYLCHDIRVDATTVIAFNFMDGRWPQIVEEPQIRMAETLKHPNVSPGPMFVHLVFLTTVVRWWNNALHSVNEQLIAYEKGLQEEMDDESAKNASYNDISKALHAMAAHVHRYRTELDSLEDTGSEIERFFAATHGQDSPSLVGIGQVKSQLKATNAFVREQEKKIQNILALVSTHALFGFLTRDSSIEQLFNRMQITNDRMMVSNGIAMHAILKATQEETAFSRDIALSSRDIALRSQKLSEEMKRDSVSMKTIAILTMFFLPATSFAALLAMPFFANNKYMTDYRRVWIWAVLTVPSTTVAYAFYHFWRKREGKKKPKMGEDLEMNHVDGGVAHR